MDLGMKLAMYQYSHHPSLANGHVRIMLKGTAEPCVCKLEVSMERDRKILVGEDGYDKDHPSFSA